MATFSQASLEDVDEAYKSAAAAQESWRNVGPWQRAELLRRVVEQINLRHNEIVSWLIAETGSVRLKAELEWLAVRAIFQEAAGLPARPNGQIIPGDIPGKENRVYRKPIGVVGLISPWTWPMQLTARTLAPAIALGNGVVVRPSEETPITGGLLLAKILEEVGLPAGLVSVVVGSNSEIGDGFVLHPVPRVISFTGSASIGRRIGGLVTSGPNLKRAHLDLGGDNPLVVLEDADLQVAVDAAIVGRFLHQGQLGVSANRIIVDASVHDEFVDRFTARALDLRCGDPNDITTIIGPVINQRHLDRLKSRAKTALEEGARCRVGGEAKGLVLPAHVYDHVKPKASVAATQILGPIALIVKVADESEALRVANDTDYGLSGAVFTGDLARGERFAQALEAGMTHVNDLPAVDLSNMPYGGRKNSGIDRFGPEGVVRVYTTEHWISVQSMPRQYPF